MRPFLALLSTAGPVASEGAAHLLDVRTGPASHLCDPGQHPVSRAQTEDPPRALRGSCPMRQGCLQRDALARSSRRPQGTSGPGEPGACRTQPTERWPWKAPHRPGVPTAGSLMQHDPLGPPSPCEGPSASVNPAAGAHTALQAAAPPPAAGPGSGLPEASHGAGIAVLWLQGGRCGWAADSLSSTTQCQ